MTFAPAALDALTLGRWQFGILTVYHFVLVPLTIGLSLLVAIMQTVWHKTGKEEWLQATRFFGKLLLINFALGVATGIVQEFQFGMNWSEYSRYVGDIFGAPLAVEALLAFFLESTFQGLAPCLHLARFLRHDVLGTVDLGRELLDAAPRRRTLQPRNGPCRARRSSRLPQGRRQPGPRVGVLPRHHLCLACCRYLRCRHRILVDDPRQAPRW